MGIADTNFVSFAQGQRFLYTETRCPNCSETFLVLDRFNELGKVFICNNCGYKKVKEDVQ